MPKIQLLDFVPMFPGVEITEETAPHELHFWNNSENIFFIRVWARSIMNPGKYYCVNFLSVDNFRKRKSGTRPKTIQGYSLHEPDVRVGVTAENVVRVDFFAFQENPNGNKYSCSVVF